MDEGERENIEKRTTIAAAVAVGVVCLLVGVPIWWKTTTVYRVNLPYEQISQLGKSKIKVSVNVNVVFVGQHLEDKDSRIFQDKLNQAMAGMRLVENVVWIEYKIDFRKASTEQEVNITQASTVQDLDSSFDEAQSKYTYNMVLLPEHSRLSLNTATIGRKKTAYLPFKPDLEQHIETILSITKKVLVNERALVRAVETATGAKQQQSDKESMRKVHSHSGYQLTFNLLNPQPHVLDARWNVPLAIETFLKPLIEKFDRLIHLKTKSQYLHSLGLGTTPVKDAGTGQSVIYQQDLPHIINPIEAYLTSHVSTDPDLNFVVYIPSRNQVPLKIVDNLGSASSTNSFVIPRWGGFLIYNIENLPENSTWPLKVELDMNKIMSVVSGQIRLLLGITTQDPHPGVEVVQPGSDVITQWELDFWLRSHCIENIANSVLTLSSLANLVEKINNMVINDHIGSQVEKSVELVEKAHKLLQEGNLREAFVSSRNALTASESAFFDQSLLELLYFPEDQKFAIYIPLFLPIGIPIVMSLLQAAKYLTKKPDKQKTE